ncbi:MAG: LysE family translocator [Pseudomonadota bacterium]
MTSEDLIALATFAFVATITPGPNNLMILANAASFGMWRTLPHMLGVSSGIALMIFLLGLGLDEIYDAAPWLHWVLKILGTSYLLWLAFKIATARVKTNQLDAAGHPLRYWEAIVFQVVNPKTWTIVVAALAFMSERDDWYDVLVIAMICFCFSITCAALWAWMGSGIARVLADPVRLRWINYGLGGLLVLSVIPLLNA